MQSGQRVWRCELSLIDTTLLIAGILTASSYFADSNQSETEIRESPTYYTAASIGVGRRTARRPFRKDGNRNAVFSTMAGRAYSRRRILYVLAMASPTHPIPASGYHAWTTTYQWENLYGHDFLYAGPLFIHQFSHAWIDFRGIQDRFMREKRSDYFENSRQATYIQREYALRNPHSFRGYGENFWGLSAGDGPEPQIVKIDGQRHRFFGYTARGVPYGAGRWNDRSCRDARIDRFCAGDRVGRDSSFSQALSGNRKGIPAAERNQSNARRRRIAMMDNRRLFRSRSGHCRVDDRELSIGTDMEVDASMSIHQSGTE